MCRSSGNVKPTEHAWISSITHRHTYTKIAHMRGEEEDFGRETHAATTMSITQPIQLRNPDSTVSKLSFYQKIQTHTQNITKN